MTDTPSRPPGALDGEQLVSQSVPAQTVLIVDDDNTTRWVLAQILGSAGFACVQASNGEEAVEMTSDLHPDLILMDVSMPGLGGLGALTRIRSDFRTTSTPVIFLTSDGSLGTLVEHLDAGADDYLVKPSAPAELIARAKLALRRSEALRDLSPLTRLPGNGAILREIAARVAQGRPLACMHIDIDSFKAYNDHYGFARGDLAIMTTADTLIDAIAAVGDGESFLGHIGGDDFLVVSPPELDEQLARAITQQFDAVAPSLYDEEDRERGWIEVRDRRGEIKPTPLMSLSIGIARTDLRQLVSAAEIAAAASELKGVAKRQPNSSWVVDRRRSSPPDQGNAQNTAANHPAHMA